MTIEIGSVQIRQGIEPGELDLLPNGTTQSLRVCDLFAWQLANLEGAPAFNLCWDENRRNRAIAAIGDFLRSRK